MRLLCPLVQQLSHPCPSAGALAPATPDRATLSYLLFRHLLSSQVIQFLFIEILFNLNGKPNVVFKWSFSSPQVGLIQLLI